MGPVGTIDGPSQIEGLWGSQVLTWKEVQSGGDSWPRSVCWNPNAIEDDRELLLDECRGVLGTCVANERLSIIRTQSWPRKAAWRSEGKPRLDLPLCFQKSVW